MDLSFLRQMLPGRNEMPNVQTFPLAQPQVPVGMPIMDGGANLPAQVAPVMPQVQPQVPLANVAPDSTGFSMPKFGWLETLRNDPNAARALQIAGLTMMSAQPGQDTFTTVGQGALKGLDYYERKTLNDAREERARQQAEQALQKGEVDIQTAQTNLNTLDERNRADLRAKSANAGKAEVDLEVAQKTVGDVLRKAQAEADKATDDASLSKIKTAVEKRLEAIRQKHPEWEENILLAEYQLKELQPKKVKAEINQANATAANSAAQARRNNALAEGEVLEVSDLKTMTPEARLAYNQAKGSSAQSGANQTVESYMKDWEVLNPVPTDAAAKQAWMQRRAAAKIAYRDQITNQAKVNRVSALKAIVETAAPNSPEHKKAVADLQALTSDGNMGGTTNAGGAGGTPVTKVIRDANGNLVIAPTSGIPP